MFVRRTVRASANAGERAREGGARWAGQRGIDGAVERGRTAGAGGVRTRWTVRLTMGVFARSDGGHGGGEHREDVAGTGWIGQGARR